MQNNVTIPNVSSVFRQLVMTSHSNPQLNSSQNNKKYENSYSYQNMTNNKADQMNDMGLDDRQRRHQQLMGRLKNSMQQNKELLGVNQSKYQRHNNRNQFQQSRNQQSRNQYSRNQYHQQPMNQYSNQQSRPYYEDQYRNNDMYSANSRKINYNNGMAQTNQKKWTAPKIKYRHIQDLQQKSASKEDYQQVPRQNQIKSKSIMTQNKSPDYVQKQIKLKQQFYQSRNSYKGNQENNTIQPYKNNDAYQSNQQDLEAQLQMESQNQRSYNKISRLSQKPSKYGQNLQSYYDLCRKPLKPSSITEKVNKNQSKGNDQKFIRKNTPKVQGINLQKAMRILSLDD